MDASLLLVGDSQFQRLMDWVREIASLSVETAADPLEAMPLIMAQQPDLLLVQAAHPESLALCHQVKEQSRLAWIYCIVINDQAILDPDQALGERLPDRKNTEKEGERSSTSTLTHFLTTLELTSLPDLELSNLNLSHLNLAEQELISLEAGADAYLYLAPSRLSQPQIPSSQPHLQQNLLRHRLQAQIRVGLRQVQTHRELMRTNDVLSAIALSDPLTSLNNRRAFEWELPRQIQNARDRRIPISLIMLDVDFFKSINDTYGHLTGDQVLKFLAARLSHNLRIYDTPFRYGGEEFVIILSNTDREEAMMIANRLCQIVSEQPFAIDETLDLTVTISAGTATLAADDDSKGVSLLQRADQCLLSAKAQGRNRVVGCG